MTILQQYGATVVQAPSLVKTVQIAQTAGWYHKAYNDYGAFLTSLFVIFHVLLRIASDASIQG